MVIIKADIRTPQREITYIGNLRLPETKPLIKLVKSYGKPLTR